MSRRSVMIAFDPVAFRDAVKNHGKVLSDLEPVTGVSKQAINGWLTSAKIPPRQLHTIAQGLSWKSGVVGRILKKPGFQDVCFRTHRNVDAGDEAKNTAKRLAADFFTLDTLGGGYNKESFVFRVGKDAQAAAVADGILRQLNLKRGQFGLEELILSLGRVSISVIFLDFGYHFSLNEKAAKNLRAFCAKQGPRFIIAVDSQMKGSQIEKEDLIWAIFHELAHISCGDMDDSADDFWEDSKAKEKFRNEIASEVLTPTDLLLASRPQLEKLFTCSIQLLPSRVEHVASELGASFVGVVLALKKIGILTSQMERYLWGVQKRRDLSRPRVKDFISPPQVNSQKELIFEWGRILNNENLMPFLKLHLLIRQGLIEERLSTSRAAELLGVEAGDMEELAKSWAEEVSDEASY